jgi:apolipoprotein N-acyltransferase
MTASSAEQERRRGLVWIVGSVVMLIALSGMWWLVEETNEEGTHDAELLPFFALIPLVIGAYHLVRSRRRHP